MRKQRPFAGERNPDGSRTLWYAPEADAECTCEAAPSAAHAKLCPQAPRVRTVGPRVGRPRSTEVHLRDVASTAGLTDVAERVQEAREAFELRQARNRFNPLANKLGAALGRG